MLVQTRSQAHVVDLGGSRTRDIPTNVDASAGGNGNGSGGVNIHYHACALMSNVDRWLCEVA